VKNERETDYDIVLEERENTRWFHTPPQAQTFPLPPDLICRVLRNENLRELHRSYGNFHSHRKLAIDNIK
jgi:hypothetical protein